MHLFDTPGKANTKQTLSLALTKAQELSCPIVLASCSGYCVGLLAQLIQENGQEQQFIVVTHVAGFSGKGEIEMPADIRAHYEKQGIPFITAAHALSAGERALSKASGGIYPLEIAARTLRMFGQGVKVCVEIGAMAMDTGLLTYGKPVVAVGGSAQGADAAIVITPSYSASLFEAKIHEIICKPALYHTSRTD